MSWIVGQVAMSAAGFGVRGTSLVTGGNNSLRTSIPLPPGCRAGDLWTLGCQGGSDAADAADIYAGTYLMAPQLHGGGRRFSIAYGVLPDPVPASIPMNVRAAGGSVTQFQASYLTVYSNANPDPTRIATVGPILSGTGGVLPGLAGEGHGAVAVGCAIGGIGGAYGGWGAWDSIPDWIAVGGGGSYQAVESRYTTEPVVAGGGIPYSDSGNSYAVAVLGIK